MPTPVTLHDTVSEEFGFDVPVVVRTPAQLRAAASEVDSLRSPLSPGSWVYAAFLDGAPDVPGERADVHGDHLVLWLDTPPQSAKLTNAVIEKRTGRVATTRDFKVVRALAEKWGA